MKYWLWLNIPSTFLSSFKRRYSSNLFNLVNHSSIIDRLSLSIVCLKHFLLSMNLFFYLSFKLILPSLLIVISLIFIVISFVFVIISLIFSVISFVIVIVPLILLTSGLPIASLSLTFIKMFGRRRRKSHTNFYLFKFGLTRYISRLFDFFLFLYHFLFLFASIFNPYFSLL